jgi:hypothetical protein
MSIDVMEEGKGRKGEGVRIVDFNLISNVGNNKKL